ncbi:MAG: MFS transporter [Anaerolineaceae bacterium]|nr:MFS transporter [Anaerolineaceae bacterium]
MKRATVLEMLVLNTYWVGLSFMWNSLHPIVLPAVLLNFVPETQKNTYLGLLTFVGLVIAMIIQPLSGALSDTWSSRWGRRRPFILLGTLFDFVFLALLAWSGGLLWLAIGYICLQFSSNIAHGPMQALLPDRVPREQIGAASGIKNLMDMGGLVVASLLAGRLLDPQTRDPLLIMVIVIGVLAVSALITLLGTPEAPAQQKDTSASQKPLADLFKIDFKANSAFWWLIGSRFAFLIGIYGIQTFTQYYLRDVLQVPNPIQQTGDLLAVITLTLIVLAVAGGWLCDRLGPRRILVISGLLGAAGCLLLLLARSSTTLILFGSVLGAGIGLFLTANWTLATRLAPPGEEGKFLGLTNLATAGAGALGRLEGPMIDLLNNSFPGTHLGYTALFVFGALGTLVSILLLMKVKE